MSLDLNPPLAGLPCRYPTNGEWPSSPAEHRNGKAGKRKSGMARDMLVRSVVAVWMNMLIAAVVITALVTAALIPAGRWPDQATWAVGALKLFVLWCLAFLPGWLYIRFLRLRALSLWNEYVLALHRLGWDWPWNLPRPPRDSQFFANWAQRSHDDQRRNIYRQKFEAYYGRDIAGRSEQAAGSAADDSEFDFRVQRESLFPLFLCTTVFAVGWTVCLWNTDFLTAPTAGLWEILKFAFMGSYLFVLLMLIRRFYQSDLKPSAYAAAVVRIVVVLIIVAALHHVIPATNLFANGTGVEIGLAFLIGFFPLVGLQLIHRTVSVALGWALPALTSSHPLDQLDGLNIWYESRLLEEGVEDMQNLATMNLVDVVLHTRVPTGRLIDWIDQAHLLLRLGPLGDRKAKRQNPSEPPSTGNEWLSGADARDRLQRAGIRGATDLLRSYSDVVGLPPGERPRYTTPGEADALPLPSAQLALLVSELGVEEGLAPVWNWKHNGVPSWTALAADPDRAGTNGKAHPADPSRRSCSGSVMPPSN